MDIDKDGHNRSFGFGWYTSHRLVFFRINNGGLFLAKLLWTSQKQWIRTGAMISDNLKKSGSLND